MTRLGALGILLFVARTATAQAVPERLPAGPDSTEASAPRGLDVRPLVLIAISTAALVPLDASITSAVRAGRLQRSAVLRGGARAFNVLGDPGAVIAAASVYAVGRVTRSSRLADVGFHAGEALVVSGIATELIKGVSGRQRPYVDERDASDFSIGQGFRVGSRTSFPSGHTTAAFAVAAAVAEESRYWWPRAPRIVVPLLYGGASLVGVARIYDARHWASDVLVGGAIGTITGRWVVRRGHARAARRLPGAEQRARAAVFLTPALGPATGVSIRF